MSERDIRTRALLCFERRCNPSYAVGFQSIVTAAHISAEYGCGTGIHRQNAWGKKKGATAVAVAPWRTDRMADQLAAVAFLRQL
jgi:hypothetical protein